MFARGRGRDFFGGDDRRAALHCGARFVNLENSISVVVPVYRSRDSLPELYQRLVAVLTKYGREFEVLFVDDCGGDDSWKIIAELAQADARVRGLRMSRNFGQHNAILAGIRAARGDWLVTLDDDLQHPPEELPKLLDKMAEGHDVVYGPPLEMQHGVMRNLASEVTKITLQGAVGVEVARHVSAYRVFRRDLRKAFDDFRSPYVNIDVLLSWATTSFAVCPVRHEARRYGKSGYSAGKLLAHAMNMMTGFSSLPLRVASLVGLCFALFGVLILGYVLVRYFTADTEVAGFPFLASIIAIFSGAQLLALGIIGEYLGRMHQRVMERPAYLIRESIGTAR